MGQMTPLQKLLYVQGKRLCCHKNVHFAMDTGNYRGVVGGVRERLRVASASTSVSLLARGLPND